LGLQALDLMPRGFPLLAVHLRGSRASQSPARAEIKLFSIVLP